MLIYHFNVLLIFFLQEILRGQQDLLKGCLQTTTTPTGNHVCLVCDNLSHYVLVNNYCQKNEIPNCLISFQKDYCFQCEYNYMLSGDFRCLSLQRNPELAINNCNFHDDADGCISCNTRSYKQISVCRNTSKLIKNCTQYRDKKKCDICDFKLLSFDKSYCYNPPSVKNCMFFNHPLSCTRCKPGFKKNEMAVFQNMQENSQKLFWNLKFWREQLFQIQLNLPVCVFDYSIENCQELDYDKKCKHCKFGFVLNPDQTICFKKPQPPLNPYNRIPNCYKFESEKFEKCSVCLEGYYLVESNTRCKKHSFDVLNCEILSQQTEGKCVFCTSDFFLQPQEIQPCLNRKTVFNNCVVWNRIQDKCDQCAENHRFHNNQTRCSLDIKNCLLHDIQNPILTCLDCDNGYYISIDKTQCIYAGGTIAGCKKYQSALVCKECYNDQKYLSQGKCFNHDNFQECISYSIDQANVCEKCQNPASFTKIKTECTKVETDYVIDKCSQYDKNQNCSKCQKDYVLVRASGNTSFECKLNPGCEQANMSLYTECIKCLDTHYLYEKACYRLQTSSCQIFFNQNQTFLNNIDIWNFYGDIPCQICPENQYFHIDIDKVLTTKCLVLKHSVQIQNCLIYEVHDTFYKCKQCRRNYYLQTSTGQCFLVNYNTHVLSYNQIEAYTASNLSGMTWGNADTKSTLNQYCQQVSNPATSCLRCKNINVAFYKSDSFKNFVYGLSGLFKYKYFYRTFNQSDKKTSELYYYTEAKQIDHCYETQVDNQRFAYVFMTNGNVPFYTFSCKASIIPSDNLYFNMKKMTITFFNLGQTDVYGVDWVKKNTANWVPSSTIKPYCNTTLTIDNCTEIVQEEISINPYFHEKMMLRCVKCATNYELVTQVFKTTVNYNMRSDYTYDSYEFDWVQTQCTLLTDIHINDRVSNCSYYEQKAYNGVTYHECKGCKAMFSEAYPIVESFRCSQDDPNYHSITQLCKAGYTCSSFLSCVNEFTCTECQGANCTNGCPADKYCDKIAQTCVSKCNCKNPSDLYDFNITCNLDFSCEPMMCQNEINKTLNQRKADLNDYDEYFDKVVRDYAANKIRRQNRDDSVQVIKPIVQEFKKASPLYPLSVLTTFADGTIYDRQYADQQSSIYTQKTSWSDSIRNSVTDYDQMDTSLSLHNVTKFTIGSKVNILKEYPTYSVFTDVINEEIVSTYSDRIETEYQNVSDPYTKIIQYMNGTIHRIDSRTNTELTTYANNTQRTLSSTGLYTLTNFLISDILKIQFYKNSDKTHMIYFKTNDTLKTMNTDTNTGTITNYPVNHLVQSTNVFPHKYQDIYKPVNSIRKMIEYVYGNDYETITPDINNLTVYYRLFFQTYQQLDPDLMPEVTQILNRREDVNGNVQTQSWIYSKIDQTNTKVQIAQKRGYGTEYFVTNYDAGHIVVTNITYHQITFANNTIKEQKIQNTPIQPYVMFFPDGTKQEMDSTGLISVVDLYENKTSYKSDGTAETLNKLGETSIYSNGIVSKIDKINRKESMNGSEFVVLENGDIFQYENNVFYYKITKTNGSFEYKEKALQKHNVKIMSDGTCWSRDDKNFQTFTTIGAQASKNNFLPTRLLTLKNANNVFSKINNLSQFSEYINTSAYTSVSNVGCASPSLLTADVLPTNTRRLTDRMLVVEPTDFTPYNPEQVVPVLSSNIYTYLGGDQVQFPNGLDDMKRFKVTFTNNTYWNFFASSAQLMNAANGESYKWNFNPTAYTYNVGDVTIDTLFIKSIIKNSLNTKIGDQYNYDCDLGSTLKNCAYTKYLNGTQVIEDKIGTRDYQILLINPHPYIITYAKFDVAYREIYQPQNNTWIYEPSRTYWSTVTGTRNVTENINTKVIQVEDSSKPGYMEWRFLNGSWVEVNGTSKHWHYANHTDKYLNSDGNEVFVIYNKYLIGDEKEQEVQFFSTPEAYKKETFFDLRQQIVSLDTYADKEIRTFRNSTIYTKVISTDKHTFQYDSANADIYQGTEPYSKIISNIEYFYNSTSGIFQTTNKSQKLMPDGCMLSMPEAAYPSEQICSDDQKVIKHQSQSSTEVYFKDYKDYFNLIVQGDQKKLKMKDFGEVRYFEDYIIILRLNQERKYHRENCFRETTHKNLKVWHYCIRHFFPNGDVGFYYEDEVLIFKIRGDLWIKKTEESFYHVTSPTFGYAKILDDGEHFQPVYMNGYQLSMNSEQRQISYTSSGDNYLIVEDFFRNKRRIYKNINGYPRELIESDFLKTNVTRIVTSLQSGSEVQTEFQFTSPDFNLLQTPTQNVYEKSNEYTLTQNISTGVITKTYKYHPFINYEVFDGTSKEIVYKQRFKKYFNVTSVQYKNNLLIRKIDGDGKEWAVDGSTFTYTSGSNTIVYDANAQTVVKTTTLTRIDPIVDAVNSFKYQLVATKNQLPYEEVVVSKVEGDNIVEQYRLKNYDGYTDRQVTVSSIERKLGDGGIVTYSDLALNYVPPLDKVVKKILRTSFQGRVDDWTYESEYRKFYNVNLGIIVKVHYDEQLLFILSDQLNDPRFSPKVLYMDGNGVSGTVHFNGDITQVLSPSLKWSITETQLLKMSNLGSLCLINQVSPTETQTFAVQDYIGTAADNTGTNKILANRDDGKILITATSSNKWEMKNTSFNLKGSLNCKAKKLVINESEISNATGSVITSTAKNSAPHQILTGDNLEVSYQNGNIVLVKDPSNTLSVVGTSGGQDSATMNMVDGNKAKLYKWTLNHTDEGEGLVNNCRVAGSSSELEQVTSQMKILTQSVVDISNQTVTIETQDKNETQNGRYYFDSKKDCLQGKGLNNMTVVNGKFKNDFSDINMQGQFQFTTTSTQFIGIPQNGIVEFTPSFTTINFTFQANQQVTSALGTLSSINGFTNLTKITFQNPMLTTNNISMNSIVLQMNTGVFSSGIIQIHAPNANISLPNSCSTSGSTSTLATNNFGLSLGSTVLTESNGFTLTMNGNLSTKLYSNQKVKIAKENVTSVTHTSGITLNNGDYQRSSFTFTNNLFKQSGSNPNLSLRLTNCQMNPLQLKSNVGVEFDGQSSKRTTLTSSAAGISTATLTSGTFEMATTNATAGLSLQFSQANGCNTLINYLKAENQKRGGSLNSNLIYSIDLATYKIQNITLTLA